MPSETAAARLIVDTLGSHPMNEYADVPRHDQLIRMALRRRRVEIRPVGERSLVFVFGGVVVGGMDATVTTLVSAHARRVTANPQLLRRHLEIQDVAVEASDEPRAEQPGEDSAAELSSEAEEVRIGAPAEEAAAAPTENEDAAAAPAEDSAPISGNGPASSSNVRVFVVGDRVCAALLRVPLLVLGDGQSSVRELLDHQALARGKHALLARGPALPSDESLSALGVSPSRVPSAGELLLLEDPSALSENVLTIDVTASMPDSLLELAVEAVAAVPGLNAAAADLEIIDLESAEGAVVSAVIPEADIRPAHFPAYGEPHDVAGAIAEEILLRASR